MNSPMVASPAAVTSDPAARYPAAKPAAAPTLPHTSARPNRARHARHHLLVLDSASASSAPGHPATGPAMLPSCVTSPSGSTAAAPVAVPRTLILAPRITC